MLAVKKNKIYYLFWYFLILNESANKVFFREKLLPSKIKKKQVSKIGLLAYLMIKNIVRYCKTFKKFKK